jgi:hypothetical protein
VSTDKRDATSDNRGIVIKRDLDAERPSRSADRSQETESKKKRFSIGRLTSIGDSGDDVASATEIKTDSEDIADQQPRSRFTSSPSVTTQIQPVVSSPFASLSMPRSKTHGPACTCISCANQRMEKLNEILTDESAPALHRRVDWEGAVRQATRPALWTVLGIAIMVFVLPVIPGPLPGWIDSVHHSLSRSPVEALAQSGISSESPSVLPSMAPDAENIVRVYIDRLNAYDSVGIVDHVTENFARKAEDQVFIAESLGTQVSVETVEAAEPCDQDACRVDVTARISGNQLTGADDVKIELTYLVTNVDGVALVNDVFN